MSSLCRTIRRNRKSRYFIAPRKVKQATPKGRTFITEMKIAIKRLISLLQNGR